MSWYVGVVGTHCHQRVEGQLAWLGYPAFYPRLRRWISHARQRIAAERPLLGPYLFVDVGDRDFGRCERIDGLRSWLVNAGGEPAPIAEAVVWDYRLRYLRGEFDLTMRNIPIGALVRICAGEFADRIAHVTAVQRGKIVVTTDGARRSVTLGKMHVVAAERLTSRSTRSSLRAEVDAGDVLTRRAARLKNQ